MSLESDFFKSSGQERKEIEAQFLAPYIFDITKFRIEVLGAKREFWQEEADDLLLKEFFVAVRSGNGVGKTGWLAQIIIWFLITKKFALIPCTAVNATQLETILWAEIYRWIKKSDYVDYKLEWRSDKIFMKGYQQAWYAIARTAVNNKGVATEALQGFHADNLMYVIDEASGVPDKAIDSLESSATKDGSYGVMTGNPLRRSGVFFRAFHENRDLWANYHVDDEKSTFMTEAFKKRMELKYGGRDTAGYRIRVKGEFPTSESLGIVSYEEYNHKDVQIRNYFPDESSNCCFSIDPAGSEPEADATTIGIRIGDCVINIITYHRLKTEEIAYKVKELVDSYQPEHIYIDSIGIGKGLCDLLELQYSENNPENPWKDSFKPPKIVRVHVGKTASNSDEFFNRRAELYWHAGQAIKTKKIKILTDLPLLEQDLTQLHIAYNERNKYQVESKRAFRARNDGRSTDFGDAFALLFSDIGMEEIVESICSVNTAVACMDATLELETPSELDMDI